MIFVLVFAICFLASTIGAICGIGGGVIIKPALDAFGIMDVSTISFLSGCTVLSMSLYSVGKSLRSGDSKVNMSTGTPLAMPSDFDEVSVRQYPDYPGSTTEARRLRDLLKDAMTTAGFRQGDQEWWHFVYGDISGYAHLNIPYNQLP